MCPPPTPQHPTLIFSPSELFISQTCEHDFFFFVDGAKKKPWERRTIKNMKGPSSQNIRHRKTTQSHHRIYQNWQGKVDCWVGIDRAVFHGETAALRLSRQRGGKAMWRWRSCCYGHSNDRIRKQRPETKLPKANGANVKMFWFRGVMESVYCTRHQQLELICSLWGSAGRIPQVFLLLHSAPFVLEIFLFYWWKLPMQKL